MRVIWLMVLCLVLAACSRHQAPADASFVGMQIGERVFESDFKLTDHLGQVRHMQDFRGKVVAIFFGYTHCPDVCPTTLSDLAQAMKLLGDRRTQVQVLFVTLDPERDTEQGLAKYVPSFDPSFIGLYGDAAAMAEIEKNFKVYARKQPSSSKGGYTIDHSAGIYVFDKGGASRLYLNFGQQPADIAHDLTLLM